jgi:hypothetical protein
MIDRMFSEFCEFISISPSAAHMDDTFPYGHPPKSPFKGGFLGLFINVKLLILLKLY